MTQLDTAVDYETSVAEDLAYTFDADWGARSAWPETTDTDVYAFKPRSGASVGETTSEPSATLAIWQLRARLAAFQGTAEDERWPGAVWPDAQAFKDAYAFILCLRNATIPMPVITLADDGEINFLWSQDGVHVDLGFYGTGTYSYFARGRHGPGIRDEEIPASEGLPAEITALFAT